jgi:hypothetical protein
MKKALALWLLAALAVPGVAAAQNPKKQKGPAAAPPVQGVISDLNKDQNAETGSVTITVGGKAVTYAVNESTVFEFVQGNNRWRTTFVSEHRGENAAVIAAAGVTPLTALKVQIILPVPKPSTPKPSWIEGTVVSVNANHITIKTHVPPPAPPTITGTVVSIVKAEDSDTGTLVVSINGKNHTYTVSGGTSFTKVQNGKSQPVTMLSVKKGETVSIQRAPGNHHFAQGVAIQLGGVAPAAKAPSKGVPGKSSGKSKSGKHQHKYYIGAGTQFTKFRLNKPAKASVADIAVGEELWILPAGLHLPAAHVAAKVHLYLPNPVNGTVKAVSGNSLTLSSGGGKGHSAATKQYVFSGTTHFTTVTGKAAPKPSAPSALKAGARVTVFPAALATAPVEKVEIHLAPPKPFNTSGKVVSLAGNILTVQGNGKNAKQVVYQLATAAKIESVSGKTRTAANFAALTKGTAVAVKGTAGTPNIANAVEIHASKGKGKGKGSGAGKGTGTGKSTGAGTLIKPIKPVKPKK